MRISQSQFRTKVSLSPEENKIQHEDSILLLGSCFAQNIQSYLKFRKFKTTYSPHGILFDPISIARALSQYMESPSKISDSFVHHSERSFHYQFHSAINDFNKEQLTAKIENNLRQGQNILKECKYLIVSFGTSIVYQLNDKEEIVANCHKMDASLFSKKYLSIEHLCKVWKACIVKLQNYNPNINIILTVSPIRHAKNGFSQNNLSKAVLLLLSNYLTQEFKSVSYFPSYEILMDELRDYRFYTKDMLHPNETAIQYIADSFSSCYFDDATLDLNQKIVKIQKSIGHRANFADTLKHKNHLQKVMDQISELEKRNPTIDFSEELKILTERMAT